MSDQDDKHILDNAPAVEPPAPAVAPAAVRGPIQWLIRFCLEQKLVVAILVLFTIFWGFLFAPFDWRSDRVDRRPVPTDAIPDTGENQQIVFTEWPGRSPQDVEDQVTYPLTVALLGVPKVQTIRSTSMFGFSSVSVIFEEGAEFYWSRSRVLEKLASLPADTLPEGVSPALGPDATGMGQIFWYTLEGRDPQGRPVGGWDLDELRSIQDWQVRYALLAATDESNNKPIAEVAGVGGFVREYQVDVDPDAMRAHRVSIQDVFDAVRMSNLDVGARTIEVNRVEYIIRGLGFLRDLAQLENTVVAVNDNVPIRIRDVAHVGLGPALRTGALDKDGADAVGGVVVVRYGENPLSAIDAVRAQIDRIAPSLPTRAHVDQTRVSREQVAVFADRHGFQAYAGDQLNHDAWLAWMSQAGQDAWPEWLTTSQVTVVPFYDRTKLIHETLGTLNDALTQQILVTIIVVIVMMVNLRSSLLISGLLPLAVLMSFIAMKIFGVDANIVALSGIAIAIGTMVDMGIVICENILAHLRDAKADENRLEIVYRASAEVGGAVFTAVATTVIGFLPVFLMTGSSGKLFKPLAYTKTFALIASLVVALTIIPPAAHMLFGRRRSPSRLMKRLAMAGLALAGLLLGVKLSWWLPGGALIVVAAYFAAEDFLPARVRRFGPWLLNAAAVVTVGVILTRQWLPLGPARPLAANLLFVAVLVGGLLAFFYAFQRAYGPILRACLAYKGLFLLLPLALVLLGLLAWLGPAAIFGPIQQADVKGLSDQHVAALEQAELLGRHGRTPIWTHGALNMDEQSFSQAMERLDVPDDLASPLRRDRARKAAFSELRDRRWEGSGGVARAPLGTKLRWTLARGWEGFGREFMPPLDEGSFLFMPTTMAHASIGEAMDVLAKQDRAIASVPEVESVVGKLGRADSPLDPAPTSMFETVINYRSEYRTDAAGRVLTFQVDRDGLFVRDEHGELVPDPKGKPFRQWREHIRGPRDIWDEIVRAAELPGTTSAPLLQPIEARRVMLQTGMRSPMGVKVIGPDLASIEQAALDIERFLKQVPGVDPATVIADRIVGKPYIEIDVNRDNREAIARHGLMIEQVQDVIEGAIGGRPLTMTVEGRERYPVRVRYLREPRDSIEALGRVLVPAPDGSQIPLEQLADIRYVRGPQEIKSEDTFLIGYVLFDKLPGYAEVDVVEAAQRYLGQKEHSGEFRRPAGVSYNFAGTYQEQLRANRTLAVVVPAALLMIFLIIYFQFRSVGTTLLVFLGIAVAFSGGLLLIWLYGQPWFLDVTVFGVNLRSLFQVHTINMSVAVWVGFLALFGIATDDGVVMGTYLEQAFRARAPRDTREIRQAALLAGRRRVRPCLMTTATTVIALLPVLTSTGRGSDIMVPMALAAFGGMLIEVVTMLIVPVLYAALREFRRHSGWSDGATGLALLLSGVVPAVAAILAYNALARRRHA